MIVTITPVFAGELRAIDLRQVHDRESSGVARGAAWLCGPSGSVIEGTVGTLIVRRPPAFRESPFQAHASILPCRLDRR